MEFGLVFEGDTFVNFRHYCRDPRDHGYRWVCVKQFRLQGPTAGGDRDVVAAVVRHEQFRDDYAGGGVTSDGTRHGPYRLDSIGADAYERISGEAAARILREWVDRLWSAPAELEAHLRREVLERFASAGGVYHLPELGDDAVHDWGRVHDRFHEFVVIDRAETRVALVVAADD